MLPLSEQLIRIDVIVTRHQPVRNTTRYSGEQRQHLIPRFLHLVQFVPLVQHRTPLLGGDLVIYPQQTQIQVRSQLVHRDILRQDRILYVRH